MAHAGLFVLIFIGGGVTGWLTSKPVRSCGCVNLRTGLLVSSVQLLAAAVAGVCYYYRMPSRSSVDEVSLVNCATTVLATLHGLYGLYRLSPRPMKRLSAWLLLSLVLWLGYGGAVLADPGFFCRRQFDAAMHDCARAARSVRETKVCIAAVGDYADYEVACRLEHSILIVCAIFATVAYRFALWSIILLVDSGDLELAGAPPHADFENLPPGSPGGRSPRAPGDLGGGGGSGHEFVHRESLNAIELQQTRTADDEGEDAYMHSRAQAQAPAPRLPALEHREAGASAGPRQPRRKNSLGDRVVPSRVAKLVLLGDVDGLSSLWRPRYAAFGFRTTDPVTGETLRTTPLHAAASGGHLYMAQWLLDNGCTLSVVDGLGRSPLDVADDPRVQKLLKSHRVTRLWEVV
eukprot:g7017.t1